MRKPIIAGNWKMFKTATEATLFVNAVKGLVEVGAVETVICTPFTCLPAVVQAAQGSSLGIGAQNMHWEDEGAFTGEISGPMLRDLGVQYVIIGHSERRAYFAETDETVNKKVHSALKHHLIPIVCIGEKLEEREQGRTMNVCKQQTMLALDGLSAEQAASLVIAYEPIWAIGTGQSSTAADANEVIAYIRGVVAEMFGEAASEKIRIQYGGSVKPDNIADFMACSDIDGALVGGASLTPESFMQLVDRAKA